MKLIGPAFCLLSWLLMSGSARAIDVSGNIDGNTAWRLVDAPIVVTGSIDVRGTLHVDSGVLVLMSAGTTFKVSGQLVMQGSSTEPIIITSFNARAGSPTAPQPGDWGEFLLAPRQNPTAPESLIRHARIAYGSGMRMTHGRPSLEFLAIENHSAPALRVAFTANPFGSSLSATGNALNGIEIPAGFVNQNVSWRLKGIPYVVRGGLLRVNDAPLQFAPSSVEMVVSSNRQVALVLAQPAPAGGLSAVLSQTQASVLNIAPSTLNFAAGESQQTLNLSSLASGLSRVTASVPNLGSANLEVFVSSGPSLLWDPEPVAIPVGRVTSVRLVRRPVGDSATASLSVDVGGVLTLPSTVNIANEIQVPINATALGKRTIEASLAGFATATRSITVRSAQMSWPAGMSVPPGGSVPYLLSFTDPVPAGGGTVSFVSGNAAIATVPTTLPVPAGATQLSVNLNGVALGSTTITATMQGYDAAVANLTVQNLQVSFNVASFALPRGLSEPFRVRLSRPAPAGGITVSLSSSDTTKASVAPSQLQIAAGATESNTLAEVLGIAEGSVAISATAPATEPGSLDIAVEAPARLRWSGAEPNVPRGLILSGPTLQLMRANNSAYLSARDRIVTLGNADPGKLSIPGSITIVGTSGSAGVELQGLALSALGVLITPSSPGVEAPSVQYAPKVIEPLLNFIGLDDLRGLTARIDGFYLQFSLPSQLPTSVIRTPTALSTSLTVEAPSPSNIVPGFFAANGTTPTSSVSFSSASNRSGDVYVASGVTVGSYKVGAQVTGFPAVLSGLQRVDQYELSFLPLDITLGRQMQSNSVQVRLLRNNLPFDLPGTYPRSIVITVSDASKLSAPASVSLLPGASSVALPLAGLALSSGVQLGARLNNNQFVETGIPVNASVVDPAISFFGLDSQRVIGAPRDDFFLKLVVPNSSLVHSVRQPTVIGLSVFEASPSTVVSGIFREGGSSPIVESTINTGDQSELLEVGSPAALGSYRVRTSLSDNLSSPWTSTLQSVVSNALLFNPPTRLGVGFEQESSVSIASAAASAVNVALSCSPATVCNVPSSVSIPAGGTAQVLVKGLAAGNATITATPALAEVAPLTRELTVVMPEFEFDAFPNQDCIGGFCGRFTNSPGDFVSGGEATFSLVEVQPEGAVSIVRSAVQRVIPGEAGSTEGCWLDGRPKSVTCVSGAPESTRYRVRVRFNDVAPEFTSEVQSGVRAGPLLSFAQPTITVGRGLGVNVDVSAYRNGFIFDTSSGLVTWNCANSSLCTVPTPLALENGSAQGQLIALANGSTQLTASTPDIEPALASLSIVDPQLSLTPSIPSPYRAGNVDGYLDVNLNGFAVAPVVLTVTTSVNGIVSVPATGTIAAGTQGLRLALTALAPGTVTLTISAPGLAPVTTAPIVVTP